MNNTSIFKLSRRHFYRVEATLFPDSYSDEPASADGPLMFDLLNEVGISAQLSRALLESRLEDGLTIHHYTALNHLVRLGLLCQWPVVMHDTCALYKEDWV
ncbi:hypothetical protein [Nitrincola sp. MINF-07-Sa-05]|uniref:hypothetical protein n=1 Tax=Nitrincola salilacus TaxID=3400273 RepID=UPI00391803C8